MVSSRKSKSQRKVKAFEMDIAFINEQSLLAGCSTADFIHLLCVKYQRSTYQQELEETFELLQGDKELETEEKLWEVTVSDGLEVLV